MNHKRTRGAALALADSAGTASAERMGAHLCSSATRANVAAVTMVFRQETVAGATGNTTC